MAASLAAQDIDLAIDIGWADVALVADVGFKPAKPRAVNVVTAHFAKAGFALDELCIVQSMNPAFQSSVWCSFHGSPFQAAADPFTT